MFPLFIRRLRVRRRGASYSLPMVLVAPLYILTILVIFEIGGVLLAQIGTRSASHAAARSAAVWDGQPDENADRTTRAAVAALTPFLWGHDRLTPDSPDAVQYAAALRNDGDLARKYTTAARRTSVAVEPLGTGAHRRLRVTVTYQARLRTPVVSRLLSRDGSRDFRLVATSELPAEGPESASGTLGIDYSPDSTRRGDSP